MKKYVRKRRKRNVILPSTGLKVQGPTFHNPFGKLPYDLRPEREPKKYKKNEHKIYNTPESFFWETKLIAG